MAKDVRMIAALMDDTGDKLLDATRKLCNAFSDLLTAAEPETKEVHIIYNCIKVQYVSYCDLS